MRVSAVSHSFLKHFLLTREQRRHNPFFCGNPPLYIFPSSMDTSKGVNSARNVDARQMQLRFSGPWRVPGFATLSARRLDFRLSCCLAHERAIISDHETSPTQSGDINWETNHGTKSVLWWGLRACFLRHDVFAVEVKNRGSEHEKTLECVIFAWKIEM